MANESESESQDSETPDPAPAPAPPRSFKTKDGKTVTIGGKVGKVAKVGKSLWAWLAGNVGDKDD